MRRTIRFLSNCWSARGRTWRLRAPGSALRGAGAELQPSRSLSANPLFQVMFVLQASNRAPLMAPVLRATAVTVRRWPDRRDRHRRAFRFDPGVASAATVSEGMFEYSTDLFVPTIERMARHMRVLAEAVAEQPDLRLSQLPLLTEDESVTLQAWNATAASILKSSVSINLRASRAKSQATALVCGDVTLSYGEPERRANQLAHYLQTLVSDRISCRFVCRASLEMVVGLLGILGWRRLFAARLRIIPAERVAFMMQDAEVDVVLTQQRMALRLPAHSCRRIAIDADWPQIARYSEDAPSPRRPG